MACSLLRLGQHPVRERLGLEEDWPSSSDWGTGTPASFAGTLAPLLPSELLPALPDVFLCGRLNRSLSFLLLLLSVKPIDVLWGPRTLAHTNLVTPDIQRRGRGNFFKIYFY